MSNLSQAGEFRPLRRRSGLNSPAWTTTIRKSPFCKTCYSESFNLQSSLWRSMFAYESSMLSCAESIIAIPKLRTADICTIKPTHVIVNALSRYTDCLVAKKRKSKMEKITKNKKRKNFKSTVFQATELNFFIKLFKWPRKEMQW